MRLKNREWIILALPVFAIGIFLAAPDPQASPRLVSVQQLPEKVPLCEWNESSAAEAQENLFSARQQDSGPTLMAALQQGIADLPNTEQQEREAREARARGARTAV